MGFGLSIDVETDERRSSGFAGFVGSLMLFMAFFAMAWAALDPTTNVRMVMAYSFIYFGGFVLSLGFGFKLSRRVDMKSEITSIVLGIVTGVIVLSAMAILMFFGTTFATNQSVAFALLAPVAETMAFVVAPYHLFRYNFPEAHWLSIAIPSNVIFSIFHYYRYFAQPNFILIWIILVVGNTFFVYLYHLTKNATAPILAHFVVNLASSTEPVINFLIVYAPLFIVMFLVFAFIFYVIGGSRK